MTGEAEGAYVLSVLWQAKAGSEAIVGDYLRRVVEASAGEPGVITFHAAADPERPGLFTLFEVYRDKQAHATHMETPHFKECVLKGALPHLEQRERTVLRLIA